MGKILKTEGVKGFVYERLCSGSAYVLGLQVWVLHSEYLPILTYAIKKSNKILRAQQTYQPKLIKESFGHSRYLLFHNKPWVSDVHQIMWICSFGECYPMENQSWYCLKQASELTNLSLFLFIQAPNIPSYYPIIIISCPLNFQPGMNNRWSQFTLTRFFIPSFSNKDLVTMNSAAWQMQ